MSTIDMAANLRGLDARIHGVSFNPTARTQRVFGVDDLARELADADVFSWIDVEAPDISALNAVLGYVDIDLVLTGTPEGVALSGRFPYLAPGDIVELGIDGLGHQRQHVVATV